MCTAGKTGAGCPARPRLWPVSRPRAGFWWWSAINRDREGIVRRGGTACAARAGQRATGTLGRGHRRLASLPASAGDHWIPASAASLRRAFCLEAARQWNIDPAASWMIGDRLRDIQGRSRGRVSPDSALLGPGRKRDWPDLQGKPGRTCRFCRIWRRLARIFSGRIRKQGSFSAVQRPRTQKTPGRACLLANPELGRVCGGRVFWPPGRGLGASFRQSRCCARLQAAQKGRSGAASRSCAGLAESRRRQRGTRMRRFLIPAHVGAPREQSCCASDCALRAG